MKKKWEKMEETEEKEHVKEGSDIKKDSDIKVEQSCENFVDVVIQEMQVEADDMQVEKNDEQDKNDYTYKETVEAEKIGEQAEDEVVLGVEDPKEQ